MDNFEEYLYKLTDGDQKDRLIEILNWIHDNFPNLGTRVAWNQPMFTDHGTFIIGFSVAKNHISVAPEKVTLDKFQDKLDSLDYGYGKQLFKIANSQSVDYSLLKEIIDFNIEDKQDVTKFWRS